MKLAALLPRARFGALLLAQAKYNLSNKYHFFGFTEQMDEFEKMVAEKLGWRHLSLRDDTKVTRNRPSLDAIAEDARASILQGNLLDIELYSFAQKLFAERLERNGRGDAIHSAR
jgi:hypothetical protein